MPIAATGRGGRPRPRRRQRAGPLGLGRGGHGPGRAHRRRHRRQRQHRLGLAVAQRIDLGFDVVRHRKRAAQCELVAAESADDGIARRLGLAAHFGVVTGLPSIGVGKKILTGEVHDPPAGRETASAHVPETYPE